LQKTFRFFDKDGSNTVDFREFKAVVDRYCTGVPEQDTKALFEHFDKDKNGKLNYSEFVRLFEHKGKSSLL